jgi:hypothetical protein
MPMKNNVIQMQRPDISKLFLETLAALACHANNKRDYTFPLACVVVTADHSVTAMEFTEPQKDPELICELTSEFLAFPLNIFFSCGEKLPLCARMNDADGQPEWLNCEA